MIRLLAYIAVASTLQPSTRLSAVPSSQPAQVIVPGDVVVMMNGLPGNMASEVAAACVRRGMSLAEYALTGVEDSTIKIDSTTINLVRGGTKNAEEAVANVCAASEAAGKVLIAIDYTVPEAAAPNAEMYSRYGVSFVMGTTGADRGALERSLSHGTHMAVIAPNMGKQIVAMQAAIQCA